MSAQADVSDPPAELRFWLDLVRARTAALLHRLAGRPDEAAPTERSTR